MLEYERQKQNYLFSTIKRNTISDNAITAFVQNERTLSKHIDDIVSDNRLINNGIIRFTKNKLIRPSDSTCKIVEIINLFNTNFNNNENKFVSLTYGCRNDVAVSDKFDTNGVSIFISRNVLLPTEYSL